MKATIKVLSAAEKDELFDGALKILATTGIKTSAHLPAELKPFFKQENGSGILLFDESLIRWALSVAPKTIPIFNLVGQQVFCLGQLGPDGTRFGVGVTNLYTQNPHDGSIEPFARESFRQAVQLGEALPAYDLVSTPGILHDLPPGQADLAACLDMAANTTKPLVVLISHKETFGKAMDLIQDVQRSSRSVLPYFNPQTPLLFPTDMLENLAEAVGRGLPVIISNYGMLGATTPASLSGTAALLLAELLAGLVISQCLKEGSPVILGSLPAGFDMRSAQSCYTPHTYLLNLAIHEVLSGFGLPTCGTSGCEDGWGMDLRAAGQLWFNHLTASMGGVDMAPFVGGIFNSKVFSPELVVYADTIIRQVRQFTREYPLHLGADLLEEIRFAGFGRHFLLGDRTLQEFRRFITPDLFPYIDLEEWRRRGSPGQADLLKARTLELLAGLQPPAGFEEMLARGGRWF